MKEKPSSRIEWIDIAKGISMVLIVISHIPIINSPFVETFKFYHVPIFILLSGLFFKPNLAFKDFISKYASRLLKPYYIYGFLIAVIWHFDPNKWLHYILGTRACASLWFLTLLFSTMLITYIINKLNNVFQWIIILVSIFLAWLIPLILGITLPMNIDAALYMLPFFFVGFKYRTLIIYHKVNISISLLILLLFIVFSRSPNLKAFIPNAYYQNYAFLPISIIGAFAGCYMIIGISHLVNRIRLLYYSKQYLLFVGENSIIFLLLQHKLFLLFFPPMSLYSYDAFVRFITCMLFCSIGTIIINRWLKWTI